MANLRIQEIMVTSPDRQLLKRIVVAPPGPYTCTRSAVTKIRLFGKWIKLYIL